jgi:preprotein translocase subunit SecD
MNHKDTKNTKNAILLVVAWFLAADVGCAPSNAPIGTTLVYEVDKAAVEQDADIAAKVVDVLNRRINPGRRPMAQVRRLDGGRIEVGIYGNDAEKAKRVQQIADRSGTLEFRVLATRHDDLALVERALAEPDRRALKDATGVVEARWVPVTPKGEKSFAGDPQLATRQPKPGGLEVLVKIDAYNVTGDYLKQVAVGVDRYAKPTVSFQFNATGGKLFGGLTNANLPTEGFSRRLGIILDGDLYSAPTIHSAIYDRGEITGNFSHEEVEDLVRVLNAGSLPAKIVLVEKRESKDAGGAVVHPPLSPKSLNP